VSAGDYFGVSFVTGHLRTSRKDHVVMCSLSEGAEFPAHLRASFKRLFLSSATCAKCGSRATEIILRDLRGDPLWSERPTPHVVCMCGYPVWRISFEDQCKVEHAIQRRTHDKERNDFRAQAEGKHSAKEIREILALQGHRCIYCNKPFNDLLRPEKDHLVPMSRGGTNWALNIVFACKRCNIRRETIPFRTFCKLLSAAQNRRILANLSRRILTIDPDKLVEPQAACLFEALLGHNPRHHRVRTILRYSATARLNASKNKVIPNSPAEVLKRERLLSTKRKPKSGA
jgi:HNH endonuclease